jgi:hypothetical protein
MTKQLNRLLVSPSSDGEVEEFVVELVLDPNMNTSGSGNKSEQLEHEGARFARFVFENLGGLEFASGFQQEFARLLQDHPEQVASLAA